MKSNNNFVSDAVYESMKDIWQMVGSSTWFIVGDVVWGHMNLSLLKPLVISSIEEKILDLNENC